MYSGKNMCLRQSSSLCYIVMLQCNKPKYVHIYRLVRSRNITLLDIFNKQKYTYTSDTTVDNNVSNEDRSYS